MYLPNMVRYDIIKGLVSDFVARVSVRNIIRRQDNDFSQPYSRQIAIFAI